jgi:organic radical activating enzyme
MASINKPLLPFVEMMVTQACNLSCHGCTNYSDLSHAGYLSWNQGRAQLEPWLDRVEIPDFGIFGGEPLMNPDIQNWVIGVRQLLPNTQIRFTTNGLLLKKHYDIVKLLADIGNCVFKIGVHVINAELEEIIDKIYSEYDWKPVTEFGVHRHETKNKFRFHVKRPDVFWKTYQGTYDNMRPHNNDPTQAFELCCQKTCPLLYQGRIFKCSTAGLLQNTLDKFGNPNAEQWSPFVDHGILPDCSDGELQEFLNNFGKPNKICGQCPTINNTNARIMHLDNVSFKKKIK